MSAEECFNVCANMFNNAVKSNKYLKFHYASYIYVCMTI